MKALVIDDDPGMAEVVALCIQLRWPEAMILRAQRGEEGLALFRRNGLDFIVVDLTLPDVDGVEVCRQIRKASGVPLIALTTRDRPTDLIRALEVGADDGLTKPFDKMEFLARLQAVLRRSPVDPDQLSHGTRVRTYMDGMLTIDFRNREVRLRGQVVKLTSTEYNLLQQLASRAGRPVSHRDLLASVWGQDQRFTVDCLKVHVQHMRRKLGDDPNNPRIIATERGIGYRFVAQPVAQGERSGRA